MQQQTKQPVSTFTVLLTIIFLSIFIIMPPVARALYPKEDSGDVQGVPADSATELPGLTCTKDYASLGVTITSTSSHVNGSIVSNQLMSTSIEVTSPDENPSEQEEYNSIFQSILNGIDASKVIKTDSFTQFKLDSQTSLLIEQNPNAALQWNSKAELRSYYEELGFICSDSENLEEEEIQQETQVPETLPEEPVTPTVPEQTPVAPTTPQVPETAPSEEATPQQGAGL